MSDHRLPAASCLRRLTCAFCVLLLLNVTAGCAVHRYEIRLVEQMPELDPLSVREAVLQSGEVVRFDEKAGAVHDLQTGRINGRDSSGAAISLDTRDVLYLHAEVLDSAGSFILSGPALLGFSYLLLFIAIVRSGGIRM